MFNINGITRLIKRKKNVNVKNKIETSLFRLPIAFLIAPAVPIIFIYVVMVSLKLQYEADSMAESLGIFAYFFTFFIGAPVYFILHRYKFFSLKAYLTFGALIGGTSYVLVIAFILSKVQYPFLVFKNTIGLSLLAIGCSTIASFSFWLIGIRPSKK
ncbi:hypothetical protein H8L32_16560 [Undibacterium sp. CY18W]|uniref:Uncharacterized protein n=1 Tax=Undibacterium hunanense TaxID=2762292 RepID=A0ABR6ZTB6_9BURK|nr:hypothetical protein [Undibacterium hunanense]MBC3919105.1 hypothetical protein [Undibacterium hunanense]